MRRTAFVNGMLALSVAPVLDAMSTTSTTVAGVAIPNTAVALRASSMARESEPVEIFNHSLRTYLFAELIARAKNVSHDSELVYVASILHDTGMSPQHMSAQHPFEVDGANVARKLLNEHGITGTRSDLTWDAIALHDNGGIAQHKQTEVMLVNAGVSADFGSYLELLKREDIIAVLEAAPRTNFIEVFLDAAAVVATRKPLATAHSFVADVGYCKVPGFHLPSFCEAVKTDPFADYTT